MLTAEDLKKMSVSKLREYMKELEGADLELANTVLEVKLKRNEQLRDEPGVAAEIANAIDKNAEREALKAERDAARTKMEEEKAALKANREKMAKEKEAAKAQMLVEKAEIQEKIKAEKEAARIEKEATKAKAAEKRAAEKLLKEEEKKAGLAAKQAERDAVKKQEAERLAKLAEKLRELGPGAEPKISKTEQIRNLMAEGKTNREIADATGFSIKFVCDNVWRITKMIEAKVGAEAMRAQNQ